MIYINGTMQLVCLQGENDKHALFLCLGNLELIKARFVTWSPDGTISWAGADYKGKITQHLKDE